MMKFVSPAKDGAAVAFYIYRNHVISATHQADILILEKAKSHTKVSQWLPCMEGLSYSTPGDRILLHGFTN